MFESEMKCNEDIVKQYKEPVKRLCKYLPWLLKKNGTDTMVKVTPGEENTKSFPIPTYDPTLLNFIKELENTGLINKNYSYVYSRYTIRDSEDEHRMIKRAQIHDMEMLFSIFSCYVIKGRTKGIVWKEGVENGVYLETLLKCKEIIEFWDVPFDAQ